MSSRRIMRKQQSSEKRPGSASNRAQSSSSKAKDDSFECNDGKMPATRELIQYLQNNDRLINSSKKELEELETSVACKRQDQFKLEDMEKQLVAKTKETQKLEDEYQKEIYKLHEKIGGLHRYIECMKNKETQALKDEYQVEIDKLQQNNHDLKRHIECMKNGNNREGNTTSANTKDDYDDIKKRLERKENELRHTKLELADTKTRSNKSMWDKIADNKPTVPDLSDMNRPTKLAERYKELYDNQWTDAFEILDQRIGENENKNISILLTVFTKTKEFCDQESKRQVEEIQKVITQSEKVRKVGVPDLVVKYIKDCRKASSAESIREVYKKYQTWLLSGNFSYSRYATSIKDYTDECFELCWLMAIQDPPVVLAPEPKQGEHIHSELSSGYTVSGNTVDFLVWPALLLHKDGPVLTKGVVQALKRPESAPAAVVRTERSKDFQPGYDIGHRATRTNNEDTLLSTNKREAWAEEDDAGNKYRPGKRYDQDQYRDNYWYGGSTNYTLKDLRHENFAENHRTREYNQTHVATQMAITAQDQYGAYTHDRTPYTPSSALATRYFKWKQVYGAESARGMMGSDYDQIEKYFS